ncbi:hypothetical protein [Metabacillus endolithicus]|uniref:Histidine kinase n=1 Tax=Metabacillus endolithicus TaxID=1535204 RepID=A0ABW5BZB4_9BACI|nr:hypothetical protein [Metabacillus endolithicus]UPG61659.1 hypothetical protein MVE64_13175 [Metabacillus endolithicus]
MQVYSGKLVIDLATIVNDADKNIMKNNAHEALTSELIHELRIILGAAGYLAGSVGATLDKVEDAHPNDYSMIESYVEQSKKDVQRVYNKANRTTFRIE